MTSLRVICVGLGVALLALGCGSATLKTSDGGLGGGGGSAGKGSAGRGSAGQGGAAGMGAKGGTGGSAGSHGGTAGQDAGTVTVGCDAGTHNCAGMGCVSDNSVAHCGGLCGACTAPNGGTAVCGDGGVCDFTCGSLKKCAGGCGACCADTDCPAQNGKTGTCDTSTRTCNYLNCASGYKSCGSACILSANCCADSDCATCQSCGSNGTCVAVTGKDDPVASRCAGTCDSKGACKSKQGQTCNTVPGTNGGCISGTTCAPDGYCCDMACTGPCVACDLQGFQGTCTNLGANSAPHSGHSACAGSGTCAGACGSGATAGTCVYPTGNCGNGPFCSGTGLIPQATCNTGTCATPSAQACMNNLICSQSACKTSCTADADCVNGYFCETGSCHLAAVAVAAGGEHACVLLSDGSVRCWGYDFYGQLGDGQSSDTGLYQSPTPLKATLPGPATMISAGGQVTCALLKTGDVYCWGDGNSGDLGTGSLPTTNSGGVATPAKVKLNTAASAVAVSASHTTCAIAGGNTWCWGNGNEGELGNGMFSTNSVLPVQVSGSSFGAPTFLAGGYSHLCAGNGTVWCWGDDAFGQLGNNVYDDASGLGFATPQSLYFSYPSTVTAIASGNYFTCGLLGSGNVYCWGEGDGGQLGNGSFITASPYGSAVPTKVTGTLTGPTAISAAGYHICALTAAGTISCWGGNQYGELGNGSTTPSSPYGVASAVQVVGLGSQAIAVGAGNNFTCAVLKNGSVWCWGINTFGQLGNSSGNASVSPLQIPGW